MRIRGATIFACATVYPWALVSLQPAAGKLSAESQQSGKKIPDIQAVERMALDHSLREIEALSRICEPNLTE